MPAMPATPATPIATRAAPACTDLSCRRLGWSFYLPERNLLSVAAQRGGRAFLVGLAEEGCTTVSTPAPGRPSLKLLDGTQALVEDIAHASGLDGTGASNTLSAQASLAFVARPDGSAGAQAAGFRSVRLELADIAQQIDIDPSPRCVNERRLDPDLLRQLERLSPIDPQAVAQAASWEPYVEFLRTVGSHVVVQHQLGSRLLHWESTLADGRTGAGDLVAKTCVALEGLEQQEGWLVDDCRRYPNRDRGPARGTVSASQHLVQGGTKALRLALQAPGPIKPATLRAFMASARQADQAAGLAYLPVWRVLESIYGPACTAAGAGSPACKNLQRAIALQATYEGRLAIGCDQLMAQGFTYQQMAVAATSALGLDTYQCALSKTGCRSHASCHLYGGYCYCHGPDCIVPGAEVPGVAPQAWRNDIRWGRAGMATVKTTPVATGPQLPNANVMPVGLAACPTAPFTSSPPADGLVAAWRAALVSASAACRGRIPWETLHDCTQPALQPGCAGHCARTGVSGRAGTNACGRAYASARIAGAGGCSRAQARGSQDRGRQA